MPSSSSRIAFGRPLRGAALAIHDGPAGPGRHLPGRFDLKELQRRAFERGQAVERERGSKAFAALAGELRRQAAAAAEARAADRARVEEFAARLALRVAERLTFATIDAGAHDVAGMVRSLVAELGPAAEDAKVRVRLAPCDHALLLEAAARGEIELTEIETQADPALAPGGAVLVTEDIEYWSELADRIERLRGLVIAEARHD